MKPILIVCLVGSIGYFGCNEVLERPLENDHVTLVAPANNLVSDTTIQSFYWQPIDSGINYELQVVSPRFDSIAMVVVDTVTGAHLLYLSLSPALYQWRVRAFNSSSTTSFSNIWTLTVQ
jgi:hypothetical protein